MKKYILFTIACIALASCTIENTDTTPIEGDPDRVTRVSVSANSPQLIANGVNTLNLETFIFGEVLVEDEIEEFAYDKSRFSPSDFVLKTEDGTVLQNTQFTTTSPADSIGFFVEFRDKISPVFKVKLVQPSTLENQSFQPITIPVIFHMITGSFTQVSISTYTTAFLQERIDRLNRVFKGTEEIGATNVDLKMTFVLATETPTGGILPEKGMNRVYIGEDEADDDLVIDYIKNNKSTMWWDTSKYLNIWVNYSESDIEPPAFILEGAPQELADLDLTEVSSVEDATATEPDEVGIFLIDGLMVTNSQSFENQIATFYGLIETDVFSARSLVDGDADYISDTWSYFTNSGRIQGSNNKLVVLTDPALRYTSTNIMDNFSRATVITYEQALRLRTVADFCPFRMMRQ